MTQATEARRWKLVAFASLALLVGYVAGQLTPSAAAQVQTVRFQLDTSNCRAGYVAGRAGLESLEGAFVTVGLQTGSQGTATGWAYNICR
jgi:hypothetical protein